MGRDILSNNVGIFVKESVDFYRRINSRTRKWKLVNEKCVGYECSDARVGRKVFNRGLISFSFSLMRPAFLLFLFIGVHPCNPWLIFYSPRIF